jgi:uncharacterized delta-60 repeat protein
VAQIDLANTEDFAEKLLREPDGDLIAIGHSYNGNRSIGAVARFTPQGQPDTPFGSGGKLVFDPAPRGDREFYSGVVLDDGKILVGGFGPVLRAMLLRLLPNGQPDPSFGPDGTVFPSTGDGMIIAMTHAPHGGVYASVGNTAGGIWKLTDAGALDPSFGAGGQVVFAPSDLYTSIGDIVVQPDESILVSREIHGGWLLARVLPAGVLDMSFGGNGTGNATVLLGNNGFGGNSLALQPDGRAIVVGGNDPGYNKVIARYLTMPIAKGTALDLGTKIVNIRGDDGVNVVNVMFDSAADEVVIEVDDVTSRFAWSAVTRVDVRSQGANDTVNVTGALPPGMIDAGAGDDVVTLDGVGAGAPRKIFAGAGDDRLVLANGQGANLTFDGGDGTGDEIVLAGTAGSDVVSLLSNTINALGYTASYTTPATERLTINALAGEDVITLGSTLRAKTTVNAGDGDDEIVLTPAEKDFYGNRLGHVVTLFGGAGADSLAYTGSTLDDTFTLSATKLVHGVYDTAFINQIESALLHGNTGNDTFVLDVTATAVLTAYGDGGTADAVRFPAAATSDAIAVTPTSISSGTQTIVMSSGIERASVYGGGGNDVITLTGSAPAITLTVFGEAGDDTLNVEGGPWAGIVFHGGTNAGTNDTLNVNAGTFTFANDARTTTLSLTINVATGASVLFNATQRLAALNVDGGTATLASNGNRALVTRALTVTAGGVLDLTNNALVFDYGSAAASPLGSWDGSAYTGVSGLVATGASSGTGSRIVTSSLVVGQKMLGVADARDVVDFGSAPTKLWSGQTVDASSVLVKYTFGGDANLDGAVSGDDYARIDFNVAVPGASGWHNGDFNHDGVISGDDYSLIDFNIVPQVLSLAVSTPSSNDDAHDVVTIKDAPSVDGASGTAGSPSVPHARTFATSIRQLSTMGELLSDDHNGETWVR